MRPRAGVGRARRARHCREGASADANTGDARVRELRLAHREEPPARGTAARAVAAAQRRALASSPVAFDYASGAGLPLFDAGSPLRSAGAAGLASARTTLAVELGAAALLAPPAVLLLLLTLLRARLAPARRRFAGAAA